MHSLVVGEVEGGRVGFLWNRGGGVPTLLFEACWSDAVLAIGWRAPVKPCYSL